MQAFDRVMTGLGRAASVLAGLMLAAIVIINTVNVFGRYVLSAPLPWAEEVMLFLMIGAVFLSNLRITGEASHIRMDMLLRALPGPLRKGLEWFADLATIAIAGVICWVGAPIVRTLYEFGQTSDAAGIPVWIPQSVIPLSFGLVLLTLVARLLAHGPGGAPQHSPGADDAHP